MTHAACEVLPGAGSVLRRGAGVLWAATGTPEQTWATLAACLSLPAEDGTVAVLRAVHAALEDGAGSAYLLLIDRGGRGCVLRHGSVELRVDGRLVQGAGVTDGLPLSGPVTAGQAGVAEAPVVARHDLAGGAAPGAGFRWSPVGSTANADVPVTLLSPTTPDQPVTHAWDPDFGAEDPSAAAEEATAEPDVRNTGVQPAPTPSAPSLLIFEDGQTTALDNDVVLGRRPERHQLVASGAATAMPIEDPAHVLSSAHAAIRILDGEIVVVDLDSLNGTHVAAPDAREWTRLAPQSPQPLTDGYRLLLGWTVLTYRSAAAAG